MLIAVEERPACADVKLRRAEPRMKVMLDAVLASRRGPIGCRVHDISQGGAMVEADCPHTIGEVVAIERSRLKVSGTVVWSRGKRFGIQFDAPIRATELLVQMSHSRHSAMPAAAAPAAAVTGAAMIPFPSR